VFRYRLQTVDGGDLGEATYAMMREGPGRGGAREPQTGHVGAGEGVFPVVMLSAEATELARPMCRKEPQYAPVNFS
jgi:hypothetical protein